MRELYSAGPAALHWGPGRGLGDWSPSALLMNAVRPAAVRPDGASRSRGASKRAAMDKESRGNAGPCSTCADASGTSTFDHGLPSARLQARSRCVFRSFDLYVQVLMLRHVSTASSSELQETLRACRFARHPRSGPPGSADLAGCNLLPLPHDGRNQSRWRSPDSSDRRRRTKRDPGMGAGRCCSWCCSTTDPVGPAALLDDEQPHLR